jgi:hypothetical protein
MIRAKDILSLLEEWVKVPGGDPNFRIEVLIDSSSWQEVVGDFKYEWKSLKEKGLLGADFPRMIRFAYHPNSEIIKSWVAFWANHDNILGKRSDYVWWCGEIDPDKRVADVAFNREFVTSPDSLPPKLQKFLRGLKLVNYTLC